MSELVAFTLGPLPEGEGAGETAAGRFTHGPTAYPAYLATNAIQ